MEKGLKCLAQRVSKKAALACLDEEARSGDPYRNNSWAGEERAYDWPPEDDFHSVGHVVGHATLTQSL